MSEIVQRIKNFLFTRQQAYQQTFSVESIQAKRVLIDLAKFCRANQSTFHTDDRAHAVLEGRREVWLRIQNQLNLSQEKLWEIYGRKDLE